MSKIQRGRTFNCTHGNWELERFGLEQERDAWKARAEKLAALCSRLPTKEHPDKGSPCVLCQIAEALAEYEAEVKK